MSWDKITFLRDEFKNEISKIDATSNEFIQLANNIIMEQLAEDIEANPHHYPASAIEKLAEYKEQLLKAENGLPNTKLLEVLDNIISDLQ